MGIRDTPRVRVHEIDVGMNLVKRVPLGSLQKFLNCLCMEFFVKPVPNLWNVVIAEVRHETRIFKEAHRTA
jgi:hypothetical protein